MTATVLPVSQVANAISRESNPVIFQFLKRLNDRGEISAVLMKIIIDSFWGLQLPIVSEAKFARIVSSDFDPDEVYRLIGATHNTNLFISALAVDVLIDLGSYTFDAEIVKRYHAAIVRFFL